MDIVTLKRARLSGLKRYFTGLPCKRGHLSERLVSDRACLACAKEAAKRYHESDPSKNREREKRNRDAKRNDPAYREAKRIAHKKWRDANIEHVREYARKRAAKLYAERKEEVLAYMKGRNATKNGRMETFIRNTLRRSRSGDNATVKHLGYSAWELIEQIEKQFTCGMSWDNFGEWHIDHIKPISAFLEAGEGDVAVINALSNLRPLWAKDNLQRPRKYHGF